MATKRLVPSMALLRSLAQPPMTRPHQHRGSIGLAARQAFHSSPRCLDEPRSFRAQLYESTAQRVERQRLTEEFYSASTAQNELQRFGGFVAAFVICSGFAYYAGSKRPYKLPPESTLPLVLLENPEHNLHKHNLQSCWADLVEICGPENVSEDESDLQAHSGSDWSSYTTKPDEKPTYVVRPGSTQEVSKIMKACHRRKIPVTAYSGGTSLEGHFSPTRGGLCIDFGRMDEMLTLHKEDLDVVVQPGLGWESLNEELAKEGLFFPPDPGPGARIGGMIGTGCSGTNAYRYGTMKDWVISLTVVMADGAIIKTRQRPRKSSAGYDLTRMFIGSEGTLGLVTEATLKVTVKPKSESVAVASFGTIRQAAECVSKVVGEGIPVAAVEILDDVQMRCINDAGATSRTWKEAPTLFFKFAGTPSGVKEQIGIVQKMAKSTGSQGFEFARNSDEAAELWSARKEALWSVMAKRRDENDHVWTTDVAVPISRLPDIIEQTKEDIQQSGLTTAATVGHAGDGNFHTILLFNETERSTAEGIVHRMAHRAIEMEGTVTGEHGVGLIKRDYLPDELGESTVDAMRKLKQAFDPRCILNCDKIVRVERMPETRSPKERLDKLYEDFERRDTVPVFMKPTPFPPLEPDGSASASGSGSGSGSG